MFREIPLLAQDLKLMMPFILGLCNLVSSKLDTFLSVLYKDLLFCLFLHAGEMRDLVFSVLWFLLKSSFANVIDLAMIILSLMNMPVCLSLQNRLENI